MLEAADALLSQEERIEPRLEAADAQLRTMREALLVLLAKSPNWN
jgi:hypothetical protein